MKKIFAVALVATLAASAAFAIGEARLQLKVVDEEGRPVGGATVTVTATEKKTFEQTFKTDKQGEARILLLDGTIIYKFLVEKDGYVGWEATLKLELLPNRNERTATLTSAAAATAAAQPATDPAVDAYNEGAELANQQQYAEAVAKLKEAASLNPELGVAHAAIARIYFRQDNWQGAIEHALEALEIDGDDPAMFEILAVSYGQTGKADEAAKYAQKAPANPALLFNEAVPHLNAGDDAKAEPLLLRAIQVDDSFARAHYELGSLYARAGKTAEARKHLQRYVELEPSGENADLAKELLTYLQ